MRRDEEEDNMFMFIRVEVAGNLLFWVFLVFHSDLG
jgi:hypothetical protein